MNIETLSCIIQIKLAIAYNMYININIYVQVWYKQVPSIQMPEMAFEYWSKWETPMKQEYSQLVGEFWANSNQLWRYDSDPVPVVIGCVTGAHDDEPNDDEKQDNCLTIGS